MEKYCINCGEKINADALFCKYCGASQSTGPKTGRAVQASRSKIKGNPTRPKKPSPKKPIKLGRLLVLVLILGIIAALVAGGIWLFKNLEKDKTKNEVTVEEREKDKETAEQDKEKTVTAEEDRSGVTEKKEDTEKKAEEKKDEEKKDEDDSYFKVGEQYTVQDNLRVREGPGKNYRILERSELKEADYKNSVNSTTTTDALMEKGSKIVCLEVSGNWIRIESGWVCTEDGGEILVK